MEYPFHWLVWIGLGGGLIGYVCPIGAWIEPILTKRTPPLHKKSYLA
jgi:hypothetical protein